MEITPQEEAELMEFMHKLQEELSKLLSDDVVIAIKRNNDVVVLEARLGDWAYKTKAQLIRKGYRHETETRLWIIPFGLSWYDNKYAVLARPKKKVIQEWASTLAYNIEVAYYNHLVSTIEKQYTEILRQEIKKMAMSTKAAESKDESKEELKAWIDHSDIRIGLDWGFRIRYGNNIEIEILRERELFVDLYRKGLFDLLEKLYRTLHSEIDELRQKAREQVLRQ